MASPNAFVCFHQRLGFSRTYAFIFCASLALGRNSTHHCTDFIGAGALFAFTLARVQYLNIDAFCPPEGRAAGGAGAAPGECFYFAMNRYRIPLILHLATIFPASLLAVVQFLPIIRRKFILYHRVAGYVAVFLALVSMSAAVALTPKSFGGASATQAAIALLSVAFAGALVMAIVNIRRKQVRSLPSSLVQENDEGADRPTPQLAIACMVVGIEHHNFTSADGDQVRISSSL